MATFWNWFFQWIYGSIPAEFESCYDLRKSVDRLRSATDWSFFSLAGPNVQGSIDESRVVIRSSVFSFISWRPNFYGNWHQEGNRIILKGKFTKGLPYKVFASVWFGFIGLWTLLASLMSIVAYIANDPNSGPMLVIFPLAGVGMFIFGLGMISLQEWWSEGDIVLLTQTIREALWPGD